MSSVVSSNGSKKISFSPKLSSHKWCHLPTVSAGTLAAAALLAVDDKSVAFDCVSSVTPQTPPQHSRQIGRPRRNDHIAIAGKSMVEYIANPYYNYCHMSLCAYQKKKKIYILHVSTRI